MRNITHKNKLLIEISGEPIEAITNFIKSFTKFFQPHKNIPLIQKTIFEGKQYSNKSQYARAIIFSFSKKYPELARKFYSLAESKTMTREMNIQVNRISPLWYQTVMEYFKNG